MTEGSEQGLTEGKTCLIDVSLIWEAAEAYRDDTCEKIELSDPGGTMAAIKPYFGGKLCNKTVLVVIYVRPLHAVRLPVLGAETKILPMTARCQTHSWAWASIKNSKPRVKGSVNSSGTSPGGTVVRSCGNIDPFR